MDARTYPQGYNIEEKKSVQWLSASWGGGKMFAGSCHCQSIRTGPYQQSAKTPQEDHRRRHREKHQQMLVRIYCISSSVPLAEWKTSHPGRECKSEDNLNKEVDIQVTDMDARQCAAVEDQETGPHSPVFVMCR